MSNWKEALGQTQSMLEGLHIPSGLVASTRPPGGAGGCRNVWAALLSLLPS